MKTAYPDFKYYEWIYHKEYSDSISISNQIDQSIQKVVNKLKDEKFDGLLGFSQGAGVVTAVLQHLKNENLKSLIQCAVLISGFPPSYELDISRPDTLISIPNLHIIGDKETDREQCVELTKWYTKENQQILTHPEDHRIPSINTGVYPDVLEWLKQNIVK